MRTGSPFAPAFAASGSPSRNKAAGLLKSRLGQPTEDSMAQDDVSADRGSGENRYGNLGDEVAFVLASARDASAEMRAQAKQYSESLLDTTREEADSMLAAAQTEAERLISEARIESDHILATARRRVLSIIETAQGRVEEAERAAQAAAERRDAMLSTEADVENGLVQVIVALQKELERMRLRRAEVRSSESTESPKEQLDALATQSTAEFLESELHTNGNGVGTGY